MRIEASFLLLLSWTSSCLSRGPHHPHGQTPVAAHQHHYRPSRSMKSDAELIEETRHLQEDLRVLIQRESSRNGELAAKVLTPEVLSKMTLDEVNFYIFATHDLDNNSKLDGLEILKNVYRLDHPTDGDDVDDEDNTKYFDPHELDTYITLTDEVLDLLDKDGDGYVSYAEFRVIRTDRGYNFNFEREQDGEKNRERDNSVDSGSQEEFNEIEP